MKGKMILAALGAAWACVATATDMEHKMKVVKSFTTALGAKAEVYDTFGSRVATLAFPAGLQDVPVPASGYVKLLNP